MTAATTGRAALAALLLAVPGTPSWAGEAECRTAIAATQPAVSALPPGDLSRRYAQADLDSAAAELSAGDPDECEDLARRAGRTAATRPYVLRPGEVLDGYGPDGPLRPLPPGPRSAPP